ncbi:MAG: polysaccharide deacetylase family protein [Sedimentisphaerales bacterium]|nr:polysaccharide deacetylase family protein [Sedimentisphaerales bacterium]
MICLTGDVHHRSMNSLNQNYFAPGETEVKLARSYLDIARRYNLKVTLFITGRAFEEEFDDIQELFTFDNLEIAGHGYNANLPDFYYRFNIFTQKKWGYWFSRQYYKYLKVLAHAGSNVYQHNDIKRTIHVIQDRTGRPLRSWRSHAYLQSDRIEELLARQGVKVISDEVRKDDYFPRQSGALVSLPVNTLPDHDHIFHGARTQEYYKQNKWKGNDFGCEMVDVTQWLEIVKGQITDILSAGGIATVSAHPECMWLADRLVVFERLCRFLSQFRSLFVDEVTEFTHAAGSNTIRLVS